MTTYQHIYPFAPWGMHGGTLRLRTALDGSRLRGATSLHWLDRTELVWRDDVPVDLVGSPRPEQLARTSEGASEGIKRRVFPFALWESGFKPRRSLRRVLLPDENTTVILHTAFLAPFAARLRREGHQVVVDVHDVIFRAHLDEAARASGAVRNIRRAYATSVRFRERRAMESASALAVAGWTDTQVLADLGLRRARWAPTGLSVELSRAPETDRLRVGLIGNFHHTVTAAAARALVSSPLGRDRDIQIIFAGIGSEHYAADPRVLAVGAVTDVKEFYDQIHATVVPVSNGSGMKCKLAEGALAGKAVITTPRGAAGYPPELQEAFVVVDNADVIDKRVVVQAIENVAPQPMRDRFDRVVGRRAAAITYAQALDSANEDA